MVTREKDGELALFLEMRRRDKNNDFLLLNNLSVDHPLLGDRGCSSSPEVRPRKTAADNFLNLEADKSDYEWLLTPPTTPLFPSLENEMQRTGINKLGMSDVRPNVLKQRITNVEEESASRKFVASKNLNVSSVLNSSIISNRRPSPKSASRPATPTRRPTIPATSKTSRPSTPTSRATTPGRVSTPTRSTSRAATPTWGPPNPSNERSSSVTRTTPYGRSSSVTRSIPPGRSSSVTRSSPAGRSSSVTRTTPSGRSSSVTRSLPPGRSSSVTRSSPASRSSSVTKSAVSSPSRGISPAIKSRPWKPSDMPGFSHNAPPNLRTTMPERPVSASRGRPGAAPSSKGIPRQQSCSPSRGRPSNTGTIPCIRRTGIIDGDNVSPVVVGSKMVERIVNMRKLVPPKQDDHRGISGGKSWSLDRSGFGRNLSKTSLDMAMRHMDITRSISGKLRPITTSNIPASSMYSVRSRSTKSRTTTSVSDSSLSTSSTASSELISINDNPISLDNSKMEDSNLGSER